MSNKSKDYKNNLVFANIPAKEILIINHTNFIYRAWKSYEFITTNQTLYVLFNMSYRTKVANFKNSYNILTTDAQHCPIMKYDGGLYFNFYYGNNGVRIAPESQILESENQNNDSTFGLGVAYCTTEGNTYKSLEINPNCSYDGEASVYKVASSCQGTDHGIHCTIGNTINYNYAIFIK